MYGLPTIRLIEGVDQHLVVAELALSQWAARNVRAKLSSHHLLDALEGLGKLAHAHLEGEQGTRSMTAKPEAIVQDAVGDTVVCLINYCASKGWSFESVLRETLERTLKQDWMSDPSTVGGGEE